MKLTSSTDRYKWVVWGTLVTAFFIVFFHRYSTAVVADDLSRALSLSGAQLSNLASMYFYAYALMQIPSGILADYMGPRRTCSLGMLLAALGSLVFALSTGLMMAYVGRLLVGLGVSVVFVSLLKTQAVWFRPQEFATISGLTAMVGNLGGISATFPLALAVLALGWNNTFSIIALLSLVIAVLIYLYVRDRPEDMGLRPQVTVSSTDSPSIGVGLKHVLSSRQTLSGTLIMAGVMGGVNSVSGLWGIPYLMHVYGLEKAAASNFLLAMTLGVLIGSPLMGYLADRLGKRKPIILAGSLVYTGIWAYIVLVAKGQPALSLLYPLFFVAGLAGISFFLCFALAKEANPPAFSGIAMGVVNTGGFLSGAVLNVVIGSMLDARWQGVMEAGVKVYPVLAYRAAFMLYLLAGLAAVATGLTIKEKSILSENIGNT